MKEVEITQSDRGFNQYGAVVGTHGIELDVYQSSSAQDDSPLWLAIRDEAHTIIARATTNKLYPAVHLDRKGVKRLIKILQAHLKATK